jgi:hypothetical protein
LPADISERYDRAEGKPEIVEALRKMMKVHMEDVIGSTPDQLVIRIESE